MNKKEILLQFNIDSDILPYGDGHINNTYMCPPYIMQRINTEVFHDPVHLMENVLNITEHLKKKLIKYGGDVERETLTVMLTTDKKPYFKDGDKYYRVYKLIDDSFSVNTTNNPQMLESAAEAIGKFQRMLSDYPASTLFETIPDFHNTSVRYNQLKEAIEKNLSGRLAEVSDEIAFVEERKYTISAITDGISDGSVPLRVSHNDTKLNNIMFDKNTQKGLCVIDLDTVMPGSFLYDYGDFLRFAGSTAAEDEKDISKVKFDMAVFESFTKGYLKSAGNSLTKTEIELMPESIRIMTLECGMRFLADHINGDVYFRISHEGQNLDRARTQFKLVAEIEKYTPLMKEYIDKLMK